MSKSTPSEPSVEALNDLEPRKAVAALLGWWPSYTEAMRRIRSYLPADTKLELRGIYGWQARGIPRARQTAVMQAVLQDFGLVIDFATIERLTADRIAEPKEDTPIATKSVKLSRNTADGVPG
jgi:hypothetical protein